jgi:hypothetical protein
MQPREGSPATFASLITGAFPVSIFLPQAPHSAPLMAKLYFYYAAMNAGKSTVLLQSSYNYRERGMRTLLFTPSIDTR